MVLDDAYHFLQYHDVGGKHTTLMELALGRSLLQSPKQAPLGGDDQCVPDDDTVYADDDKRSDSGVGKPEGVRFVQLNGTDSLLSDDVSPVKLHSTGSDKLEGPGGDLPSGVTSSQSHDFDEHGQSSETDRKAAGTHDGRQNGSEDRQQRFAGPFVFCLSASDEPGIRRMASVYERYFKSLSITDTEEQYKFLGSLCYSLSARRSQLAWKSTFVVKDFAGLKSEITSILSKPLLASTTPALSFVFTGQGAQWHAMMSGLDRWPVFKASLEKSDSILAELGCEWRICEEIVKEDFTSTINDPQMAQPATTILQIALVDVLKSWGVAPRAVTGHSSGEIGAAYCALGLSHRSAVRVAFWRGFVVSEAAKTSSQQGGMLAVALSETAIEPYVQQTNRATGSKISVGCVNSPESVTITGDIAGIYHLYDGLKAKGTFCRKLKVNTAYHSHHMQLLEDEYLSRIPILESGSCTDSDMFPSMFSSVTGKKIAISELSRPEYWGRNLVGTVRFADAARSMVEAQVLDQNSAAFRGQHVLLEIGPHAALQRPVKDILTTIQGAKGFEYDCIINRPTMPDVGLVSAMGRLKTRGSTLDLVAVNTLEGVRNSLMNLPDLPAYPFNHEKRYWGESRLSSKFRLRQHQRHNLLGAPEIDWNPWKPTWRNVIRVAESPWIRDYVISGSSFYPAAGFLTMAIEGARQIAGPDAPVLGYHLQGVNFRDTFPVPADSEVMETALHFQPRAADAAGIVSSYEFSVMVIRADDEQWIEACYGTISVERHSSESNTNDTALGAVSRLGLEALLAPDRIRHWDSIRSEDYYSNLTTMGAGLKFERHFQTLDEIRFNNQGQAMAGVTLDRWTTLGDEVTTFPHVIHPTDLDGLMQVGLAGYSRGGNHRVPIVIPTKIQSMRVSHSLLARRPATKVSALSKITSTGFRESDFSIAAVDQTHQLSVIIEGFRQTVIDLKQGPATRNDNRVERHAYNISYKPELELLDGARLHQLYTNSTNHELVDSVDMVDRIEMVCLWYMRKAVEGIEDTDVEKMPKTLQRYMQWLRRHYDPTRLNTLRQCSAEHDALFGCDDAREAFLSKFAKVCAQGQLIVRCGENLLDILRGQVDPFDLLFADSAVATYYQNSGFPRFEGLILPVVDMLAHENCELNILEVGAGTGCSTLPILRKLQGNPDQVDGREGISRFNKFTFTDISPSFFEPAKDKLGKLARNVDFKVFDIEKDPLLQDFEEGSYDLVIATGVLHVTSNLSKTLSNVRRLLKPGGKVLLFEPTGAHLVNISFVFGLLPGWWLSTDKERNDGPMANPETWDRLLRENGFSGTEVALPDVDDPERQCYTSMLSTASPQDSALSNLCPITIVIESDSEDQAKMAHNLSDIYSSWRKVFTVSIGAIMTHKTGGHCLISLVEYKKLLFDQMDESTWATFKSILTNNDRVIWTTCPVGREASDIASSSLATGVIRNVNSEKMDSRWILVSLEDGSHQHHVEQICKVLDYRFGPNENLRKDTEYREIGGELCIPRLVDADTVNQHIERASRSRVSRSQRFGRDPERALKLSIGAPGLLDTLEFDDDPYYERPLLETEVEIRVVAAGLNEKDVYVALGQVVNDCFGFECAGHVVRTGPLSDLKVGDEVCALTRDGAAQTFVRTDESAVIRLLPGTDLLKAAALPLAFSTAFYSLVMVANLQADESVLIHNAAGAVGQAALWIAKQKKAHIFATVETDAERAILVDVYGLKQERIFTSRDTNFIKIMINRTGTGIDVILGSLIGDVQAASWDCIAPLGRFVEVGRSDLSKVRQGLAMDKFEKSVSFTSVNMACVLQNRLLTKRITQGVSSLLHTIASDAHAQPLRTYPVCQLEDAFRESQRAVAHGKVVVEMRKDALVQVLPSKTPQIFSKDATYVIAGGLGGLGRCIIEWMFARGASCFMLLSRSGGDALEQSRDLIADLRALGARIEAPCCDVTDSSAVQKVLQHAEDTMPPIRGCLQAAMVLKDGLFATMPLEDWQAVLRPKTIGTANLSAHLPKDLDFFVLFSSIGSVLGTRGQGNYGVANTYLDTMARTLVSQGRHCISLNTGPIRTVGYVAEKDLTASFWRDGFESTTREEFLSLLEYACDPACPSARNPETAQIVTGFRSAQTLAPDRLREFYWTRKAMLQPLLRVNIMAHAGTESGNDKGTTSISTLLATASCHADVAEIAVEALVERFAKLLAISQAEVDPHRAVIAFGIDSMVALELRYWMAREFGEMLPVIDIVNANGLHHLANTLASGIIKKRSKN